MIDKLNHLLYELEQPELLQDKPKLEQLFTNFRYICMYDFPIHHQQKVNAQFWSDRFVILFDLIISALDSRDFKTAIEAMVSNINAMLEFIPNGEKSALMNRNQAIERLEKIQHLKNLASNVQDARMNYPRSLLDYASKANSILHTMQPIARWSQSYNTKRHYLSGAAHEVSANLREWEKLIKPGSSAKAEFSRLRESIADDIRECATLLGMTE